MTTVEERYQLVMICCDTFKSTANDVAQRCNVLLAESNNLFDDEQKTWLTRIQTAIQEFLSVAETARQLDVTRGWATTESKEYAQFSSWIHDLRTPLSKIIAYARFFLEGGLGSLNDKQQEVIEDIYKLAQGLLPTTTELLISSRQE